MADYCASYLSALYVLSKLDFTAKRASRMVWKLSNTDTALHVTQGYGPGYYCVAGSSSLVEKSSFQDQAESDQADLGRILAAPPGGSAVLAFFVQTKKGAPEPLLLAKTRAIASSSRSLCLRNPDPSGPPISSNAQRRPRIEISPSSRVSQRSRNTSPATFSPNLPRTPYCRSILGHFCTEVSSGDYGFQSTTHLGRQSIVWSPPPRPAHRRAKLEL
ncbi:hypothetical protein B0I37DRAFT_49006 [Chaetomium sp. MPI-CAGE-AT-0009]|nr:hypothetical protein B0I37DRAFT_49006 [Chaetomium sp. MPI-CAGE-AT-0009]